MQLRVDGDTYAVLPWTPPDNRRARLFCDIYQPDGTPFPGDPRGVLKSALERIRERGWIYNVGPEPEFFLFHGGGLHPEPHDLGSFFDFSPNDEAVRVRTELIDALRSMGLEVETGHHEFSRGQHEIDFRFANALKAADNVLTLKYTVKAIATQHGLVASFMPKPVFGINGSGMHCHQSLFDLQGHNLFSEPCDDFCLSPMAYGFVSGQIAHARSLAAITSPTVNSYKRLVPGFEAPVYISWAQTNRSALIRIPRQTAGEEASTRVELRFPDPSANPYLAFTAMLAAGLDGIDRALPCPAPMNNVNFFKLTTDERKSLGVRELPASLAEALNELDRDTVLKTAIGPVLYDAFFRSRWSEWEEYRTHVTDWELGRYLELA